MDHSWQNFVSFTMEVFKYMHVQLETRSAVLIVDLFCL